MSLTNEELHARTAEALDGLGTIQSGELISGMIGVMVIRAKNAEELETCLRALSAVVSLFREKDH